MNRTKRRRSGFSLVEVIAAAAIMATLTTASFALVRTANDAWRRHRDDMLQRGQAISTLQHVVRRVRQAREVAAISPNADMSGYLTLQMADGTLAMWDHNGGTGEMLYGTSAPTNLLAEGITAANFVGLTANGLSTTTDISKIHAVRCTVEYTLSRPMGSVTETVSNLAWLRSW
ncbi:MAG TPA: prepilin-type N-terminal cleavage/methylation domain-containing protein [Lacipirellula sp.]